MSKKNVNVEDVVTEGVKPAEDQATVEAVEVVSEEKKLFGKIPMKTAKKVAIVVGVSIAGIYIINKLTKIEDIADIVNTDIIEGAFEVIGD